MTNLKDSLGKLYREHRDELPDAYRWEDENDRVSELYYCLIHRITRRDELEIRSIVSSIDQLGLFDIDSLAEARIIGGKGGYGDKISSLINDIFVHNGIESDVASICTRAVCEVSKGICEDYDGKMQIFLRKHANLMIKELRKSFSFSELTKRDEELFIIHWLQNVMELPVPLSNEYVERFCKEEDIEVEDLVQAADEVDINVSVVDDLIKIHMLTQKEGSENKDEVVRQTGPERGKSDITPHKQIKRRRRKRYGKYLIFLFLLLAIVYVAYLYNRYPNFINNLFM